MKIVFDRLRAHGIEVDLDEQKGILYLRPQSNWEPQAIRHFEKFCDIMSLCEEDRIALGEHVTDLQILRIIRQGS